MTSFWIVTYRLAETGAKRHRAEMWCDDSTDSLEAFRTINPNALAVAVYDPKHLNPADNPLFTNRQ